MTLDLAGTSEFVEVTGRPRSVASPKFTEPLRDIPQTINVITSEVMEQQGATTLREVLRNVPGITFQAGEGGVPAGDQLTIRGFSARTDIFVDGVRDFGGYTRDSFNLEQVEVAKGPSSGITGRGSTGGSINQVSKAPGLTPSYDGTLGGGNADYAAIDPRHQPADRGAAGHGVPPERDVERRGRSRPRPRREPALGRRAVDRDRARLADARDAQLLPPRTGQPARVRHPVGAGQHQSGARGILQRPRRRWTRATSTA